MQKCDVYKTNAAWVKVYNIIAFAEWICYTLSCIGQCKLQQVGEYQLYGNVESMTSVELVDSCREALLLAFTSAKVTNC